MTWLNKQESIKIIKDRYINSLLGKPDEQGRQFSYNPEILKVRVEKELLTQIIDTEHELFGSWGEINKNKLMALAHGGAVLQHLLTLARGWRLYGTKYTMSCEIAYRLQIAWEFYCQYVYPGCPFPINWWSWEVGIPWVLTDIYLIAQDAFKPEQQKQLEETIKYLTSKVRYNINVRGTNGIWMAYNHLRRGLITGCIDSMEKAATWIRAVHEIEYTGEGIQYDYSYKYHGSSLNMGYGIAHFQTIGLYIYLTYETPWCIGEKKMELFSDWCLKFVKWLVYKNGIDPFIIDRNNTRGDNSDRNMANNLLEGALYAIQVPIPQREEVANFCRREIKAGFTGIDEFTASAVKQLMKDTRKVSVDCKAKYWPTVEYMISYRPDYFASVKMCSDKTIGWHSIWKENLKGWHISDGQLIIKVSGEEYRNNALPAMDWERLGGITRADGFKLPAETLGQSPFVCGISSEDGRMSCCGMDFFIKRSDEKVLKAKKSYYFIDDIIIMLGSNIYCDSDDGVETIIRHVVLPEYKEEELITPKQLNNPCMIEGVDCIYVFPEPIKVNKSQELRKGMWVDLNMVDSYVNVDGDHGHTIHTKAFETLLIPHGIKPVSEGYAVIYLPTCKSCQVDISGILSKIKIECKDNNEHCVHYVPDKKNLKIKWGEGASIF